MTETTGSNAAGAASAGSHLIAALREYGIDTIFANFGSDHPAIIEALAIDRSRGIEQPSVILCPHEQTAISAAHGYSAATGRPSAVFVHTDVGTANLGGSLHNVARANSPVLIFAGLTPYTLENELPGGRNRPSNDLQDVHDQHGIVRPYIKWSYDIRTGRNIKQVVYRALQIAMSEPRGPVYLTGAREVLAEVVDDKELLPEQWRPIERIPAPAGVLDSLVDAIDASERALVVTTYSGRREETVAALGAFAQAAGIGVVEAVPDCVNLPSDHPMHLGNDVGVALPEADLIIALDTIVPWQPNGVRPSADAEIFFVDADPLKTGIPLWYRPSSAFVQADSGLFLDELAHRIARGGLDRDRIAKREEWVRSRKPSAARIEGDALDAANIGRVLGSKLAPDAIVINEGITNASPIWNGVRRTQPGTYFANRGSSLGWSGGAALGAKLANRTRQVVALVGDGAYHLAEPMSAQWVAATYGLPTVTVVLDNSGWGATQANLRRQYPGGAADSEDQYWVNLRQTTNFAAAAGGTDAFGVRVDSLAEFESALDAALERAAEGSAAIIHASLAPITRQKQDSLPNQ